MKTAAETALIGEVTQAQIDAWKKEHKEVFKITVETHVGYFKKPNRTIIALASTKVKENPIGYVETILENTFIGGSREILENDDFFLAAMTTAEKLVEIKTAELVKL